MKDPKAEIRSAARAVALHAGGTPHERKELLAMLGLVKDGAATELAKPVNNPISDGELAESIGRIDNAPHLNTRIPNSDSHWDRSSVPDGLRNLPPVIPPPRVVNGKVRKIPHLDPSKCGSLAGRGIHQKRKSALAAAGLPEEPVCEKCRVFYSNYQRECRLRKLAKTA